MCQLASIRKMSRAHRARPSAEVGLTTARPPVVERADGSARGPAVRAGEALRGPRPPPRARRQRALGRATGAAPTTTAMPRRETMAVHEGAGLIDVSTLGKLMVRGPGGRRVPQPPLPEPLRQPQARPDPLRGARRRRRAGSPTTAPSAASTTTPSTSPPPRAAPTRSRAGSRGGWPSGGMDVHLTDVSQGLSAFNLAGPRSREILSRAHRPRLLERGVRLPRRQARPRRRGSLPAAADRLRRRARLRAPLPGGARRAPLGRDHRGRRAARRSGPSASSPSGCSACRSSTSSSARTPTPSRTRSRRRCRGS